MIQRIVYCFFSNKKLFGWFKFAMSYKNINPYSLVIYVYKWEGVRVFLQPLKTIETHLVEMLRKDGRYIQIHRHTPLIPFFLCFEIAAIWTTSFPKSLLFLTIYISCYGNWVWRFINFYFLNLKFILFLISWAKQGRSASLFYIQFLIFTSKYEDWVALTIIY